MSFAQSPARCRAGTSGTLWPLAGSREGAGCCGQSLGQQGCLLALQASKFQSAPFGGAVTPPALTHPGHVHHSAHQVLVQVMPGGSYTVRGSSPYWQSFSCTRAHRWLEKAGHGGQTIAIPFVFPPGETSGRDKWFQPGEGCRHGVGEKLYLL